MAAGFAVIALRFFSPLFLKCVPGELMFATI